MDYRLIRILDLSNVFALKGLKMLHKERSSQVLGRE